MKKILLIVVGVIVVIIGIITLPWIIIIIGFASQPNPPMPEIRYGEFPFRLVYELNGEQIIVEDVVICEYDGIGNDAGRGKYRKWKSRLESGNERVSVLIEDNLSEDSPYGKIIYREVYFTTGSADFYMGDLQDGREHDTITTRGILLVNRENGTTGSSTISKDNLLDKYGIQLISWEPSPPIVNRFN